MKQTLLALLWCLLLSTSFAATNLRYGDFNYQSNGESITIIGYAGTGGDVIIPDTIDGLPVTIIGDSAFGRCTNLTSIVIPDHVTSIDKWAFLWCSSLTNVAIPGSVVNIGEEAFMRCSNLTAITVEATNAFYSSMDGVLFNKNQTTLLAFPAGKRGTYVIPGSTTSLADYAFHTCNSLTALTIHSAVTNIGRQAISWCPSLMNINVDAANASYSSVEGILFNKNQTCLLQFAGGRAGIDTIPDITTTIGDYAFSGCPHLTSVVLPTSISSIGGSAFYFCDSLTNITLPDSISSIGINAFAFCTSLKSVKLPADLSAIDYCLFQGCTNLSNITIPGKVRSIQSLAFVSCFGLKELLFLGDAPSISQYAFIDCNLTLYYLPHTTGWEPTVAGMPTKPWTARIETSSSSNFGIGSNGFGFFIPGYANVPIVVEACTNLEEANWVVQTNTLSSELVNTNDPTQIYHFRFNDTNWAKYPAQFYRIRWP